MIDTHCHLTFEAFAGRVEEVIFAARVAGVRGVITVGTTPGDCLAAQGRPLAGSATPPHRSTTVRPSRYMQQAAPTSPCFSKFSAKAARTAS